jgi:hypothetical protein
MSQIIPVGILGQSLPEFDQIVKGNVSIKKLSKYRYRITFSKIGKFLMYQVWDKDDVNKMNAKREVGYVSAKEWVTFFNTFNTILTKNVKPLFTPTTIMETENSNYAFVIHNASLNSCGKVVFTVSTKEISLQNNTSKKLVQLPLGKCNHVRFDIDDTDYSNFKINTVTLENARKSFLLPPNFLFNGLNLQILDKIWGKKKGRDLQDLDLDTYINDHITCLGWPYYGCTNIMGEDCGLPNNIDIYNRWKNAMDRLGRKCPNVFNSTCTSGCSLYKEGGCSSVPESTSQSSYFLFPG